MCKRILILLLVALSPAYCAFGEIDQMLRSLVKPNSNLPTDSEFFSTVGGGIPELSPHEVKLLLPIAQQAVHDSRPEVSILGLRFLLAVAVRPTFDSAELLSPCIVDLEQAVGPAGDLKRSFALKVMAMFRPDIPSELRRFLSSHLEDKENSDEDARQVAVALAGTREPALIHEVVHFAQHGNRTEVSEGVLLVFGLTQTSNGEALSFIESSLRNEDAGVRWQAINAISRLPQMGRTRFLARLNEMAADPNESAAMKAQVIQAIKN